jgi:hypothetical protein
MAGADENAGDGAVIDIKPIHPRPDLDALRRILDDVPSHLINHGFTLGGGPVGGDWHLYSDNYRGMGRQYIASLPAGKHYFGGLAQFMEAFDPITVRHLLDRVAAAEAGMETAIKAAEHRGHENGARSMQARAVETIHAVYVPPAGPSDEADHAKRYATYNAAKDVSDLPLIAVTR